MKKIFIYFTLLILLTVILFYIFSVKQKDYNIIFFTLDTTRADYIDTGEGALANTPNIRNVAKEGVVCEKAYSVIPITMPSHSAIFTGKYPYELRIFNNGEKYNNNVETLAEILKKNGYRTGAVISLGVLKKEFGLNKGFDYYLDDFSEHFPHYFIEAKTITKRGLSLLRKFGKKKFFLWLHYSDPHEPYASPEFKNTVNVILNNKIISSFNMFDSLELKSAVELKKGRNILLFNIEKESELFYSYPLTIDRLKIGNNNSRKIKLEENIKKREDGAGFLIKDRAKIIINSPYSKKTRLYFTVRPNIPNDKKRYLYKKEVEYMDKEIGKIIDFLKRKKLYKRTIIVFVGDHGEGLGEYRSHFGHIHFLRPQYIGVPLIIKSPNRRRKRITYPVSTIDIVPTLLKILNIKYSKNMFSGKNLLTVNSKRKILAFTYRPESYLNGITIIKNHYQFIFYSGLKTYEEFLDLDKNRGYEDKDNLIKTPYYINIIKKMRKIAMIEFKLSSRKHKRGKLSDKTKKILESLGYL